MADWFSALYAVNILFFLGLSSALYQTSALTMYYHVRCVTEVLLKILRADLIDRSTWNLCSSLNAKKFL